MATNNATNTSNPVSIAQGGTNDNGTNISVTNGVVYYDSTELHTTAAGTSGQVLTSNGSGSAPTYQTAGAGNLVFINSLSASSSASIQFTSGITATYNSYFLIFSDVVPATSTAVLHFNITANGSFTDITSGFLSGVWSLPYSNATVTNANSAATVLLSGPLSTSAGLGANGFVYCFNVSNSASFAASGSGIFNGSTAGSGTYAWFSTVNTANEALNGFEFIMSSGNISTGTFSLYGVLE